MDPEVLGSIVQKTLQHGTLVVQQVLTKYEEQVLINQLVRTYGTYYYPQTWFPRQA